MAKLQQATGSAEPGTVSEGVLDAIGNTPLVALRRLGEPFGLEPLAKLEGANPGGSAKDRSAASMIGDAIDRGLIRPGTTVIESTSGNLGVGLAQACRFHGLELICVVDSGANELTLRTMRALGAEVRVVTEPDPTGGGLLGARLRLVRKLLAEIADSYWPNQYANEANPAAHADGTMREIDLAVNGDLDWLFVAVSTTGTLRGCCEYLARLERDRPQVVAVDACGSALFGGAGATRRLPGLGAGIETELSRGAWFDHLVRVSDLACVVGCRRLIKREAVFAGASSGGVVSAFERLAPEIDPGSRCAMILADGGTAYLETVYDDGWVERELGVDPVNLAHLVGAEPGRPLAAA